MELDEQGQPVQTRPNLTERTVSELSAAIRKTMEDTFGLVRVRGEIGRVSRPGSGHVYLDLKDDRAVISAVVWRNTAQRLKIAPEQGLEVVVTGKVTTFAGQSKYQIIIESLEPAGAGALMALLEQRKKALEAEGLFAPERKKSLPFLPTTIGVVTSPTGSVIRDVLHRISDRFPLHVIVWPVRVQGDSCANEVAAAIEGFNAPNPAFQKPDLIIVARGGGSIEDLWGFNEEVVVRAAAASQLPIISAIGHETDWTLIDLAADYRAPTPTGAAEYAVPVRAELIARLATLGGRLANVATRNLDKARSELRAAARGLGSPEEILFGPRQIFDALSGRLANALTMVGQRKGADLRAIAARLSFENLSRRIGLEIERLNTVSARNRRAFHVLNDGRRMRFDALKGRLNADRLAQIAANARERLDQTWRLLSGLSHQRVLERGFALVRLPDGNPVKSAATLGPGDPFSIQFVDGEIGAIVADRVRASGRSKQKPRERTKGGPDNQGDLF